MKPQYIYKITNPEGKVYIGQTIRPIDHRIREYKGLYRGVLAQKLIARSILKYGWSNHKFQVLLKLHNSENYIDQIETMYIKYYKSYFKTNPKGLNLVEYGRSPMKGRNHNQESKDRIRIANTGKILSEDTKNKMRQSSARKGKTDIKRKPITAYNLDMSLYMNFDCMKDALLHFNKKSNSTSQINRALSNQNKIVYNKYWR